MEGQIKPTASPVMISKVLGLSLSMALAFGAAFYAGYNRMPYVLAPCIFLVMSCSTNLVLISRYLKGRLFQGQNLNSIMGSFYLGCVLLFLSAAGCFFFAITDLKKMDVLEYKEYGLYAALVPCILAVFWSSVLIHDARHYWRMWQLAMATATPGVQIIFRP